MQIRFPDMTCVVCGQPLPPGSEAEVHPTRKGPQGGKRYYHSEHDRPQHPRQGKEYTFRDLMTEKNPGPLGGWGNGFDRSVVPDRWEITWVESGHTEIMTLRQARKEFGREEFDEIKQGYMPHIVAVKLS